MCPIKTNEKAREGNTSFRKWAPTQRREGNPQEGGYAAGVESIQSKVEQEGSGLQEGYLPRKKRKLREYQMHILKGYILWQSIW